MDPLWLTGLGIIVLAVATLILAGITFWSVKSNNDANRLLREETKQLHEKERNRIGKLQSMEIIINWANEVNNILGGKIFSLQSESPLNALIDKTRDVTIDVNSVKTASILFDDSVQGLVDDCLNSYNLFRNSIFNLRDSDLFPQVLFTYLAPFSFSFNFSSMASSIHRPSVLPCSIALRCALHTMRGFILILFVTLASLFIQVS